MTKKKAIVIGSGFGGLASAIRLQSAGLQVQLFEALPEPGGRASVFKMDGFTFDAGPTVITAPEVLRELFELQGGRTEDYIELLPVEPFYRLLWDDGTSFDYAGDLEGTLKQIRRISPADEEGYRKFLEYTKEVYKEGFEKLADKPFINLWSMVQVAPQLARLRADRSVYSTVSKYIKSKYLREAFSFHSLLVGGNPFSTSSIYTLIHYLERQGGVFFPRGGTGALVRALVKRFKELGGELHLSSPVDEIVTSNSTITGVRLKDGRFVESQVVVSNGDVVHTYKQLLRNEPVVSSQARRVESMRHSMSLFLIYFGTNRTYPEVAHHSVLFGPRYKELLSDIFDGGKLPEDFSLYLHAPTRTDPSLAPAGHEAFYVLSPVAHLGKMDLDWQQHGPVYAEKILRYLEKKCLPDLRKHLVVKKIFTPSDFKTRLNAHVGSAFSLEPILRQSAYFRVHNRDAHLRGLYFTGAGTHPGAGIPGVVSSAKATARLVQEDFA